MEKIIFKLETLHLLEGEWQKAWTLEKIANDLKALSEEKIKELRNK